MSQPPSNGPYEGQPADMPPQGPYTGGQPPVNPPTGGQPPMAPPPGDPHVNPYGQPGMPPQGAYTGGQPPMGPPPGDPYGYGPPPGDPYGYPYGQPGMPPQRKKTSPWLFVGLGCAGLFVLGVVAVVLIALVFNGSEPTEPSTPQVSSGSEEPAQPEDPPVDNPDMHQIGEEFTHEGMTYVITGVEVVDEYRGSTPSGEYLVVSMDVASATSGSEWFWMDEQRVYTADGTWYEEDYDLTNEANGGVSVIVDSGDGFTSVAIPFDVPDADAITHMGVSSETYGGNETDVALSW
ncbi:hypothetical protein [Nocardiopsis sp. LOL_012]|uniref:hypothetical protein n=1 Tax=Nocardiopsis sp. LOL_012 TaxID=3345409 RepID=UPI003A84D233